MTALGTGLLWMLVSGDEEPLTYLFVKAWASTDHPLNFRVRR